MKVLVERSGGFAGIVQRATLDTDDLAPEERAEVEGAVQRAGFFELPAEARGGGADRFQFRVTVEDAGRRHTVTLDEATVPAALRPLLDRVQRRRRAPGHA